jgi:hypothetical protein
MSEDLEELFSLYVGEDAEPVVTAAYPTWVQDRRDAAARHFENKTFKLKFNPDDPTDSRLDGTYNVDWNNERIHINRFLGYYSTQSDPNRPTRQQLVSLPHPDFSVTELKLNKASDGSYCADWSLGICESRLVVNHREFEWNREYAPMKVGVIHNSWVDPETEEQRLIFNDLAAEAGRRSTSQA